MSQAGVKACQEQGALLVKVWSTIPHGRPVPNDWNSFNGSSGGRAGCLSSGLIGEPGWRQEGGPSGDTMLDVGLPQPSRHLRSEVRCRSRHPVAGFFRMRSDGKHRHLVRRHVRTHAEGPVRGSMEPPTAGMTLFQVPPASVTPETILHPGDGLRHLDRTLENLDALLSKAGANFGDMALISRLPPRFVGCRGDPNRIA